MTKRENVVGFIKWLKVIDAFDELEKKIDTDKGSNFYEKTRGLVKFLKSKNNTLQVRDDLIAVIEEYKNRNDIITFTDFANDLF